ncbi:ComEC/Rec2 family competence protein [Oleiharenicola lentus]|uniref:ComEC/Rec2 family competence protein n=1 Tax=Oleiharenicola lentus TaxID=2508720 RepID=A0A4Q1C8B1_9BACT|nr:ComEC/Rec2 family competence protein [Oleiharenicola lentus]RXK55076.1 ComEC/Rec2 family competence protein [Oleiharenicola lentus]
MPSPAHSIRAPLLWLLLPLMAGLSAAKIWPAPGFGLWPFLIAAGLSALIAGWAARRARRSWALGALVLAGTLSGYLLLQLRYPHLHARENRPPREITLRVRVTEVFSPTARARSVSGLGTVLLADAGGEDLVGQRIYFSAVRRISVPLGISGQYEFKGVLEPLPRDAAGAGFNDYLANLGVRQRLLRSRAARELKPPTKIQTLVAGLRERLEVILRHGLDRHPQTASLYLAMLLGEKAALSPEQENAFMRSGTFHVFSVSGLHVGVIALALHMLLFLLRVPRRPEALITLAVLWVYVQVTGGGTPSVRAYVMIAFLLCSRAFRLPGNAFAALTAAAFCTLLVDPLQLFSTGFQMSYSVVTALILFGGPLADRWLENWQPFTLVPRPEWRWWHHLINGVGRKVISATAGCWAAFLASTASGIGFFGLFSLGSFVANLVILPISTLALIAGFLSLLAGLPGLLSVSGLFNSAAALIIIAADWLLRHGTTLPGVYFPARFRAEWLAPASLALMTAVMLAGASGRWAGRYGGFWPPVVLLVLLLILGVKFGG